MDTTTNQVISRSLVCVWVTGIAFPPNWTTLPHGQHMYTWSPASWKSGQPSTTRLCHTLDNHPDNYPLAGQKHIKLPALTSVGILGNDYYWIDGKRSIETGGNTPSEALLRSGKWSWSFWCPGVSDTRAHFLSLAWSKLRLCLVNHRAGYFSNLASDWLSIVWAYSKQETENGPRAPCTKMA